MPPEAKWVHSSLKVLRERQGSFVFAINMSGPIKSVSRHNLVGEKIKGFKICKGEVSISS